MAGDSRASRNDDVDLEASRDEGSASARGPPTSSGGGDHLRATSKARQEDHTGDNDDDARSTPSTAAAAPHDQPHGACAQAPDPEKKDAHIVDWDGPEDPNNPTNFSTLKKWTILFIIGSATLACTCASSMVANTYRGMEEDFHVSREVATLSLTIFLCGLGLGPLVLAPLSEFYGRRPIYCIGYFIYASFSFLVAFGDFAGLLVGRFLQGFAGSAFLSVAGGSVSDLWVGPQVGKPMAIYSACPFLGPILGPLIAAFINQSVHWRWTWYVSAIWNWMELVLLLFLVPETFAPRLLKDKAKRLRKETGNECLKSAVEIREENMGMSKLKYVVRSTGRPFEILLKEPMAFLLCLWCALLLSILYAFFSAFPIIFSAKGFNEGQTGLAFLGMGVGIIIATVWSATYWTKSYAATAKKLGHKPPPEEHLKKGMVAAVIGPISLFAFAWTSQPSVHWAAPIFLSIPFGIAFTLAITCSFTYKVDAYRPYAASAMGANSFLRSALAAGYPLFTVQMYNNLGVTWAGTLNAFLLLALTPCPFLFYKYGARLRKRSKFSDGQ